MNNSKKIIPLTHNIYRHLARNSSSDAYPVSKRYAKFLAKRARLEVPDDTPIHIKNGVGDKILLGTTWALAILGTGLSLEVFYQLVAGKKD